MTTELSTHINIGKETADKLLEAGIDSFKKLQAIGSEGAFLRLQAIDPGACINLLYALEGAIEGIKGDQLPAEQKQALLEFYKNVKKQKELP